MHGREGEKLEEIRLINRVGKEGLDFEFLIKGEEVSPEWGRDFRPKEQRMQSLQESMPGV